MLEVWLLSLALSMDAFAVSLGLGSHGKALKPALYFGLFQGLMPLIGLFIGVKSAEYISGIDHWIAFSVLSLIGLKMIRESFGETKEDKTFLTDKKLLLLAIATSIDALAAGFTLNLFSVSAYVSVCVIAAVTFVLSFVGVKIGCKTGRNLGKKAEIFGGVILIAVGTKILIEHLS